MPTMKYLSAILSGCLLTASASALADQTADPFKYRFYGGVTGGYGSTTWVGLVPSAQNANNAMIISTPTNVDEGGAIGGIFIGYELIPYFAVEANYLRFPNAKVTFDADSLYAFDHHGDTDLTTHTDTASVMGKVMIMLPRNIRGYSSFGAAIVHRWDVVSNQRRVTPTFGVGLNYNVTPHIMTEFGANYTAGFGESELNPAVDYMPFLYSIFLRLAYRF